MAIRTITDLATGKVTQVEYEPEPERAVDRPLNNWRFKAMIAYLDLDTAIRHALGGIEDPLQRAIATSRYENSAVYHRDDPLLKQMQAALKLDDATVDAAWLQIAE